MADENVIQILLQAKDLASEAINRLQGTIRDLSSPVDEVGEAFKALKISSTADIEEQKATIIAAFDAIKESGIASAEEIERAERAKNQAIDNINKGTFDNQKSLLASLKENWLALSATVIAAWASVKQALEYANMGAAAMQAEESFRSVTQAYEVDGDRLLAKMKEVSVGLIDDSKLMQRSVAALQQGLNPEQIVGLLEVARVAARTSGKDMIEAFDGITQAATTQMTRGLKAYNIVIDQSKAYEDYASKLGISRDALNEQQKSQALANAVIEEGHRQMQTLSISTLNAADKLQQNRVKIDELKESIGKGFIQALGFAADHVDGIAVALTAAAIMNAPAAIKAIITALESLTVKAATTSLALRTISSALIITAAYEGITAITKWAIGYEEAIERAEKANQRLTDIEAETASKLRAQGFTGDLETMIAQMHKAAEEGIIVIDKLTGHSINLLEVLKQSSIVMQAQIATLQATSEYYISLVKKDFETGKITMDEYVAFVDKKQKEITEKQIEDANKRIQAVIKENQIKMISEDEMKTKLAVIQEEINQIRIRGIVQHQQALDEAQQTSERLAKKNLDDTKKAYEDDFNNWKSLQELKMNTLKSTFDLQNTMDDAAVKAGVMRQSEAMQNKLDRYAAFAESQIQIAQETADRIADMEAQGLYKTKEEQDKAQVDYQKAMTEKENLQLQLEQTIITSEQQITDTRQKEEEKAQAFLRGIYKQSIEEREAHYQARLAALEELHKQEFISDQEYFTASNELERNHVSVFKAYLKESAEAMTGLADIINERVEKMSSALSNFVGDDLSDVKRYFGDAKKALSSDIDDIEKDVDQFLKRINSGTYQTFWSATLLGRDMSQMVGTSIYDWARKVTDFIQYVKGLMDSLREKILSYQDELDQLRGNEVSIVERWYQVELAKLKEQYAGELQNTQEYYDALSLLDELYREKKKRAEEEEAAAKKQQLEEEKTNASGGGAGGLSGSASTVVDSYPSLEDFAKQLTQDVTSSMNTISLQNLLGGISFPDNQREAMTTGKLDATLEINMRDTDNTERWFREELWPLFVKKFELMGLKLF